MKLLRNAECSPADLGMIEYGPKPLRLGLSARGVEGNELIIEPSEFLLLALADFSSNIQSVPNRDAVLPISKFDARRKARLIRSGKLVRLPRVSASLTSSSLSGSGFLEPTRSLSFDLVVISLLLRRKEPELFAESAV